MLAMKSHSPKTLAVTDDLKRIRALLTFVFNVCQFLKPLRYSAQFALTLINC